MASPSIEKVKSKVKELERGVDLFKSVLDCMQEPFFVLGSRGTFVQANPKGRELLGYPGKELQKLALYDVASFESIPGINDLFRQLRQNQPVRLETRLVRSGGESFSAELRGVLRNGVFLFTLKDLTESIRAVLERESLLENIEKEAREGARYARQVRTLKALYRQKVMEMERMRKDAVLLSFTDDLTGIYNRRFFIQQLTLEAERQKRYPSPLSLLMIDIDHFKSYNDTKGHLAGDQVLKAISILIRQGVRQTDILARYGGEEFAAILINTAIEGGQEIAERVRKNVAETHFPGAEARPGAHLTVSVGVAAFSPAASTATDLIHAADTALYCAKRRGRNCVAR